LVAATNTVTYLRGIAEVEGIFVDAQGNIFFGDIDGTER
jgi:hypothetical protein